MARALPSRMLRSGLLAVLVLVSPLANGVAGNQLANLDSPSKANETVAAPIEKITPFDFPG